MIKFITRQLMLLAFLLMGTSGVIFITIHVVPGKPTTNILGEKALKKTNENLEEKLSLDKPILQQYIHFNRQLVHFTFGVSLANGETVIDNILTYLPNSLYLAAAAMIPAFLIAIFLGTLAAFNENNTVNTIIIIGSTTGLSIPNFLLGPVLVILLAVLMNFIPLSGGYNIKHILFPALTLGIPMSAYLTRIVTASISTELQKPYLLLAKAKGLSRTKIFLKHVLRNAIIPIITTSSLQLGALLTGAVITETIFSWQGIGTLLIESIEKRDFPMVRGIVVFITFSYLILNSAVDVSYIFLDPRITYEKKRDQ